MPNHLIFFFSIHSKQLDTAAGMHAEIAHQILLRLTLPVAVPAGMDDENVAVFHLDRRGLDHFRRNDRPVVHMLRDIDHGTRADQKVQRIRGHVAHPVGSMHGAVDMGADMQR